MLGFGIRRLILGLDYICYSLILNIYLMKIIQKKKRKEKTAYMNMPKLEQEQLMYLYYSSI
jgi:hypothetical protein